MKYFTPREVACKETGELPRMDLPTFILFGDMLDALREHLAEPLVVNSWYRSPKHSIEKAKPEPGVHSTGLAADLRLAYRPAVEAVAFVMRYAKQRDRFRCLGVGIAQAGRPTARYLHIDLGGLRHQWAFVRPRIWSYKG